jgi:hypothetical protein
MTDVAVIVPSRGRPDRFREMMNAAKSYASQEITVYGGLDTDELFMDDYLDMTSAHFYTSTRKNLVQWTNFIAEMALLEPKPPKYFVSMGDDHMVRTIDWDLKLISAIEGLGAPGFAFGDDGVHGVNLCTSWMVSADIVKQLGWMMLPTLNHMYVDNATLDLGNASDRIVYCPDVTIEHMHPHFNGSIAWDESYLESNDAKQYAKDRTAFNKWRYSIEFEQAVSMIKGLK